MLLSELIHSRHLKDGETVARVQSDLFDFIMLDTAEDVIESRIREIRRQFNDYHGKERSYYLSLNCGVYVVSPEDKDIFTIRDRANAARRVHKAQADFQNVCVFFSNIERRRLLKEQSMENSMNKALENNEFTVYFQTKVCPADEHIVGAQALARWDSPSLGWLSPGTFIPLFERNGFIIRLDYYVFRQVCRCLRQWLDSGKAVVPVSVNLSAKHLSEPDFIEKFKAIQQEYGIPDTYLEFGLTEALVFEDMELLKSTIDRIHGAGYECSMDGFRQRLFLLKCTQGDASGYIEAGPGLFHGRGRRARLQCDPSRGRHGPGAGHARGRRGCGGPEDRGISAESRIMRSSLNQGNPVTTLEKEFALLEDYLFLQICRAALRLLGGETTALARDNAQAVCLGTMTAQEYLETLHEANARYLENREQ